MGLTMHEIPFHVYGFLRSKIEADRKTDRALCPVCRSNSVTKVPNPMDKKHRWLGEPEK
jgi:hypothetical protein